MPRVKLKINQIGGKPACGGVSLEPGASEAPTEFTTDIDGNAVRVPRPRPEPQRKLRPGDEVTVPDAAPFQRLIDRGILIATPVAGRPPKDTTDAAAANPGSD